jgi:hypothetical protein
MLMSKQVKAGAYDRFFKLVAVAILKISMKCYKTEKRMLSSKTAGRRVYNHFPRWPPARHRHLVNR